MGAARPHDVGGTRTNEYNDRICTDFYSAEYIPLEAGPSFAQMASLEILGTVGRRQGDGLEEVEETVRRGSNTAKFFARTSRS